MPLHRRELSERIALAGPSDQVRGAAFFPMVDEVTQRAPGEARRLSLTVRFGRIALQPLHFYPAADWLVLLWDACDALEPQLGLDGAMALFGEVTARQILASLLGRLVGARTQPLHPLDRLAQGPAVYGTSVTFGARTVERIDARHARMRFERELIPAGFHAAAVRALICDGGYPVEVWTRVTGLLELTLEVSRAD